MYVIILATIDTETDEEVCNNTVSIDKDADEWVFKYWLLLNHRQMGMYVVILTTIDPNTDEEICYNTASINQDADEEVCHITGFY